MKTLNINITPNYYFIIMEDGERERQSVEGVGSVREAEASEGQCLMVCVWVV